MVNHPNRAVRPAVGDVRYMVTWIDRDLMRQSAEDDDLAERLEAAECYRSFRSEDAAKAWAVANAEQDEYGNPRIEKRTYVQEGDADDAWIEWQSSDYQEWTDGTWQSINA